MAVNHSIIGDIISLTKPRITLMAVLVAWAGVLYAGPEKFLWPSIMSLLGIAALVSGSSALNMYWEREQDRKMPRTKDRPLPSGRLSSLWAVFVGAFCSVLACILLFAVSNLLTLILGLLSLIVYVFCYTPLKQKTWFSLIVGSVPGAMPVLLGYISLTNQIDNKAWALFAWAFLWQIPHFLAISLFREQEYTCAGFPVFSAQFGVNKAKWVLLLSSWLLVASTLALFVTDIISFNKLVLCLMLGSLFLTICHRGAFTIETNVWAKRAFKASLLYQGLLFLILIIGALIR